MNKQVLTLGALGIAIAWLVFKPAAPDELAALAPPPNVAAATEEAGNSFVEADPDDLPVTPAYFAVPGRLTVLVFHDHECPGSRSLERSLVHFSRQRPDVAIRKVSMTPDIPPGKTKRGFYWEIDNYRWTIWATPSVLIFDANGKLIAGDERLDFPGTDLLHKWMVREAERAAEG